MRPNDLIDIMLWQGVGMIEEHHIDKFIKNFYRKYKHDYGSSLSRLDNWKISPTLIAEDQELIDLFFTFGNGLETHEQCELIFDELCERKLIKKCGDIEYALTAAGVARAKQGSLSKFIEYFNINPGINTLVSIVAFLVSVVALYISIKNP